MQALRFTLDDLRRILVEGAGAPDGEAIFDADIGDVSFEELGYDSIAVLETVGRVQREYGISLDDSVVVEARTPGAFVAAVNVPLDRDPVRGEPAADGAIGSGPSGRVAVVTGATSGIGLSIATLLAFDGYQVFLGARSGDRVSSTVKELQQDGVDVDGSVVDVRSDDSVREFVRAAVDRYGDIDVLVNCAGISGGGVTADIENDLWHDVVDTNLNGVFRVSREALNAGHMRDRARGRIINIASTAGKQGVVLGAPYSASKHGVVGFTKALGNELARTGITVNAVCPGYVETPMAQQVRRNYAALLGTTEDAVLEKFEAKIPLGRYCTPDEVAGLVAYLASDRAASITSQALNVCGGLGNF